MGLAGELRKPVPVVSVCRPMDPRNLLPGSTEDRARRELLRTRGWELKVEEVPLEGAALSVDGVDHEKKVVVEIVGWTGRNDSSRDDKMVADAAKLHLFRRKYADYSAYLVCCGKPFAAKFRARDASSAVAVKWAALIIQEFGVDVFDLDLPPSLDMYACE